MMAPSPPGDPSPSPLDSLTRQLRESAALKERMARDSGPSILAAAQALTAAFRSGNKLLLCGNGGSAADCQHMATEFVSRLSRERERRALPAIALTTDSSFLTAFSNDCGFDGVFERQIEAHGQPGDVLIAISTSGNSGNVVRGVRKAKSLGLTTIGLAGEGGELTNLVDFPVVVPSRDTQRIQEAMLAVEHILCDLTEQALFP
jgi:D-sedoheptulose 7-phosphate isomerase